MKRERRQLGACVRMLRPVILTLLGALPALAQPPADWQAQVREKISARQLERALILADQRLAQYPADLEARAWRARLLGWLGQLAEAESEYRRVLAATPEDADVLTGLADVLMRQGQREEALALLNLACELAPSRPEILTRRGRVLRLLGHPSEARRDYRAALALDPHDADAAAGLAALAEEPRHELRVGVDADFFNYTSHAGTQTLSLRSEWDPRWTTRFAGSLYQRFGHDAAKLLGSLTYHFRREDALTAGGAAARDAGVIAKHEVFLEYGHGFTVSKSAFVRGVETAYDQHWLWFTGARVVTLTGSVILYLPRDWTWSVSATGARSQFTGTRSEWRPSSVTRLGIPLRRTLTANLFFAAGTENFAQVDQIGRFSARTFGGGARWQFRPRQDVAGYLSYQNRSGERTQKSLGISYGYRF